MKSGVRLPVLEMFSGGEKPITCWESTPPESRSLVKFSSIWEAAAGYCIVVDC